MTALVLPAAVRRAIVAHARRERPRECCGLLVGAANRVMHAVAMRNIARGTTRYRIDDTEHVALRRTLRKWTPRLEIIGVYHSHPAGEARPSPTDLAEAYYPDWAYVIVGWPRRRVTIRAFRIRAGRARELRLR